MVICPPLSIEGKELELLGGITHFKVDHQSFDDNVSDFSLFAIFSWHLLFESLIIPMALNLSSNMWYLFV